MTSTSPLVCHLSCCFSLSLITASHPNNALGPVPHTYLIRLCSSDRCFCSQAGTPLCSSCSVGCLFSTSATQSKFLRYPVSAGGSRHCIPPFPPPYPRLTRLLFPTLVAACYQQKENRAILQQEISPRLLVAFLQENLQATQG